MFDDFYMSEAMLTDEMDVKSSPQLLEQISDIRCDIIQKEKKGLLYFLEMMCCESELYIVPGLLQHFDINTISEFDLL